MKKKEWFSLKYYPHIGLPFTNKEKKEIISYIKNDEKIAKHSFLPFIHKTIIQRKLRKKYDENGNRLNNGKRSLGKNKKREIFYANHFDANIYSYYGFKLNKRYTEKLKEKGLDKVVTAYRQIPTTNGKRNKNNIDFANDVFNYIRNNKEPHLVAITFDITSFFDNLKHDKLKKAWCDLYDWDRLKDDHYAVFKNITKFSYVEEIEIFNLFRDNIYTRTSSGIIRRKKVDKLKYLYNQNAIAYCDINDIHIIRKNGLIRSNKWTNSCPKKMRDYGICQGSPISSVLANLYLLEFDYEVNIKIQNINGLYNRYSDDMVVVCDAKYKDHVIELMENAINDIAKLEINKNKTQVFHFRRNDETYICEKEFNGKINENSKKWNFEYLGFAFDGNYTLLKTSSLAKYYRKMKLNTKRCKYYSKIIDNNTNGQIFKRRLYKRFSYIGARRSRKFMRKRGTTNEWVMTKKYNWGNYITYAKLAMNSMDNNKIRLQIKKHWKNLNNDIN